MKAFLISFAVSNLVIVSPAFAGEHCSESNHIWNGTRCVAVGAGAGVAATSGIYAAKKYSSAKSIETEFTKRLFQDGGLKSGTNAMLVDGSVTSITDGDRITIAYNLSEVENREYHIRLMQDNASRARTSATSFGALALTATTTESVPDGRGGTKLQVVPDYAMRASYALMAANSLAEASDYDQKAADARRGGPVPLYELENVVDGKTGTAQATNQFTRERIDRGGKILTVDRLPAEKFNLVKNATMKARGGIVGVVTGLGLAAEEAFVGKITAKYDRSAESGQQLQQYGYRKTSR